MVSLVYFSWFACIKLRRVCATLRGCMSKVHFCPFKHQQKWRLQHNSYVCQGFLFFTEEYRTLEIVLEVALELENDRMGSGLLKLETAAN